MSKEINLRFNGNAGRNNGDNLLCVLPLALLAFASPAWAKTGNPNTSIDERAIIVTAINSGKSLRASRGKIRARRSPCWGQARWAPGVSMWPTVPN
jgi:hypothetical protein